MADIVDYEVNWDELSVGSNESFFDRSHSEHEPFHKSSEFEERLAEAQAADDKENQLRKSRATTKDQPRPQAAVRPRSLPRLATKPRATIPVTPNVLKKRIVPKLPRTQPAPFVFKAKPAPAFHKSTGNINKVATQLTKLHIEQPPKPAPTRNSRAITRCATNPAIRSKSVPQKERTIPVTPMVLKRQQQRRTVNVVQATKPEIFKAKPAQVLHRQPFKPKLNHNNNNAASAPTAKPFEFCLDNRLKDRKQFNSRTTEALEKRNKQIEEEKTRKLEEQRAAARRLTNFRATRNPFK